MATVPIKISQLQRLTGSAITSDDFIPIVDSGSLKTYRVSLGDIINLAQGGIANLLGGTDKQVLYNQGGIVYGDNSFEFNYVSKSFQHGSGSNALGIYSHSEGFQTFTSGAYAHSEGYTTYAFGKASHSEGYQTYAYGDYQTVVGQFNVNTPQNTSSLFIVGGGINDSNRADILLVDRTGLTVNGDINFSGSIFKNGIPYVPPQLWSAAGSDIFYNTGSVGIGITNPQCNLDVFGCISDSTDFFPYFINNGSTLDIESGYNTWFCTGGGNLGVANKSPQYTLDVNGIIGNSVGDLNLNARAAGASSGPTGGNVIINSGQGSATCGDIILNGGDGAFNAFAGNIRLNGGTGFDAYGGSIIMSAGIGLVGGHTGNIQLLNGNVGVNQSYPRYTLDISGSFGSSTGSLGIATLAGDINIGSYGNIIMTAGGGTLTVLGTINPSAFLAPLSSSAISTSTGSMFYSGSKLFIYTGMGHAGGLSGWQTASLGG